MGTGTVGKDVLEPGRTEIVGLQLELEIITLDRSRHVGGGIIVIGIPVAIDRIALVILQWLQPDDMQAFGDIVAIDVEVVRQQRIDADTQRHILHRSDGIIIHRRRRIVHRREVDLHARRAFATEFVTHHVIEEGVSIVIGRAEEFDHSIGIDRGRAIDGPVDPDEG